MKFTIVLIAIVFLIGISESDAQGKKNKAAEKGKGAADKNGAAKNEKADAAKAGQKKQANNAAAKKAKEEAEEQEEEQEEEAEDEDAEGAEEAVEEEEEEEEDEPPKKKLPVKKAPVKKAPVKKTPSKKEEETQPRSKNSAKPSLSDLKDQAASVNPANVLGALLNTPADKLNQVLPQMNKLTNMLDGTPLGPIFKSLTSLLGNNSPQIWNNVFQLFPNFLTTIIANVAQLGNVAVTALGRAGKSFVELSDVLFNTGKDVLEGASAIPGVGLVTAPLAMGLDVLHGSLITPLDDVATEITASSKRARRKTERALSRSRGMGSFRGF